MQFQSCFYNYYENPKEIETFHSIYKKKISAEEEKKIQDELNSHFDKQEKNLSAKRENTFKTILSMNYSYRKKFICSSWVRGFCFFQTKDCIHAHGVDDLIYNKEDDSSINAQTLYERIDMKNLTNTLNYLYLYEFCQKYDLPCGKTFTLDQINNDRTIRTTIREYTRTKMFEDFYLMIRKEYPDILLTEQFLVSEFTRIGVGSDAFGFSIKSGRIASYLMKHLCYQAKFYHPPTVGLYQNFMIFRDKRLNIHQYFKSKLLEVLWELKKTQQPFIESHIRQLVKNSQQSELEPTFDVYLVKDNMCLFRYFKSWATSDDEFFKQCTQIFESSLESSEELLKSITFDCCSDQSEKTMRKNKLIEEYLSKQYKNQKKKFCRYWLRGLCIFDKEQCQYSHGADDLIYEAYDEHIDDPEYTDFMSQKAIWKDRSYVSLFKEQETLLKKGLIDTISTQEELDNKKDLREGIREKMQNNAMEEFMDLIWKYYGKDIKFTESFIFREFTRVGFFKIGYTLKNQMIIDIISMRKCFISQTILPPLSEKRSLVYCFPDYEKIVKYLVPKVIKVFMEKKQEIELQEQSESNKQESLDENTEKKQMNGSTQEDTKNKQENDEEADEIENQQQLDEVEDPNEPLFTINEYKLRKEFYKDPQADIPPLHLISKHYNKQLSDIINDILEDQEFKNQLSANIPLFKQDTLKNCLILDSDTEKIQNASNILLQKKNEKTMFNFDKLFFKIYGQFRPQIRATIGFTKFKESYKQILREKYNCDIFNMNNKTLVLQKKQLKTAIKHNSKHATTTNNWSDKSDSQYKDLILQEKYVFKQAQVDLKERIIIVDNIEKIDSAMTILEKQSYIGVDLEGYLSKHGHIELIQISCYDYNQNHSIIYVFDFLVLELVIDVFTHAKNAIKSLMENKSIIKILQGCHKDALALQHLFNSQIVNGLDTQVVHNFIAQVKTLANSKSNTKGYIQDHQYFNCGLNSILQIYSAPNGLNPLKNKFQQIFVDLEQSTFYMKTRPMNEEFLIYSSKDVEDLIPVFFNILKAAIQALKSLYDGIDVQTTIDLILRASQVSTIYKLK